MKPQDLLARLEAGYAYDPMYGELCNERDRLSDENAKLRELVRDMHEYISSDYCHTSCKHEPNDMGCYEAGCWYDKALRELGIEVDV